MIEEHRRRAGSEDGLVIGLQLTHSGRYCRPNHHTKPEPRILYHHPVLDKRLGISSDYPLLTLDRCMREAVELPFRDQDRFEKFVARNAEALFFP